jgi:hypothetical protein
MWQKAIAIDYDRRSFPRGRRVQVPNKDAQRTNGQNHEHSIWNDLFLTNARFAESVEEAHRCVTNAGEFPVESRRESSSMPERDAAASGVERCQLSKQKLSRVSLELRTRRKGELWQRTA